MALRSYFDGGNQADSSLYKSITLASVSATALQWVKIEKEWTRVLKKHHAPWLHTTDAVGLTREFSKRNGWTAHKVDKFISDCVEVIGRYSVAEQPDGEITRWGMRPCTITVMLPDFKRIQAEIPDHPSVGDVLTAQCASYCFIWGQFIKSSEYEFFFDQGEPFYGHAKDRWTSPKSRRDSPIWKRLMHLGESDMRRVPALQIAEVFAWSLNKLVEENAIRYEWQYRLQLVSRDRDILYYDTLRHPLPNAVETIKSWKLPKRSKIR